MAIDLRVEVEPDLYHKAEFDFAGTKRPTYDDFCLGPLAAIVFTCEMGQVRAHPVADYPGIFTAVLPASGLFPPVVFSLALLDSGASWLIYDYLVDHEYWDVIGQDPIDDD